MSYKFHHVHIKSPDPGRTVEWFSMAFGFKVIRDWVRDSGDRFITCETTDGVTVNISGARNGEDMGPGDAVPHWGLEHIGITVPDLRAEITRLEEMGAELMEGPIESPNGPNIAFIKGPDDVRIEVLQLPS